MGGKNIHPQGAHGFTEFVHCLFIHGLWFLISVGLKQQKLVSEKRPLIKWVAFSLPPLPTLFLVFPKILFLAENSRVAEEDRSAQPERNLELYPQGQWHLNQLSLKQWNLTLP